MPAKHRQCPATPHEWILDIRKHNDTRVIQSLQRWRQINARHPLKTRKTGSDIAATPIDQAGAQRLQHTGATVVGGTAAQTNIECLCARANRAKHELAHAIGCGRQRRRLRARRVPDARGFGHLNDSRLMLAVHQHPGSHALAQGTYHLAGHNLTAARSNGIERSLAAIRQRQRAYLGIGPHAAHAPGNCRLCLRAQHAAFKGVDRQQHTAGPPLHGTKVDRLVGKIPNTRERLGMSGVRLKVQTAADAVDTAQTGKITTQHRAALVCQHASRHIKPMIQARIGIEVV